ncbi:MAG: response regulator [Cyanobacteria bacterium HKST-UBA06]|nr:response regulator [Cyanobacteria bacterium HKST-UBA06]MCA9840692.1 response regulator [Cyanobacteria bacterium HKST-UBA03]
MTFQLVHLIGQPPEQLADVLRAELNQENLVQSIESNNIAQASPIITSALPDLVVFFLDSLSAEGGRDAVKQVCLDIRGKMPEHRPIIVVASESGQKDERIDFFLSGADDYLTIDIEPEEFAVRLLVHLRRNVELLSDSRTRLPGLHLFSRLIQRRMNLDMPWALMMVELTNLHVYEEVYGRMPSEQILKTLAALLKSLVLPPDIVGQTDNEHFLILSTPDKAELLAQSLCKQFDEVVPNFYSERDQKRGYLISVVNENVSMRVPFVCLSIGINTSENRLHRGYQSVFNSVIEMKNLAKAAYGSNWTSERLKLTGDVKLVPQRIQRILVVEADAAMAFLLKSTLEMQGYEILVAVNEQEAQATIGETEIDMVLMDPIMQGNPEEGWGFIQWLRSNDVTRDLVVICISSLHDRDQALNAGADLYLPKPFELSSLFTWVEHFLKTKPDLVAR